MKDTDVLFIGLKIRNYRRVKKISQAELGKICGCSQVNISKLENCDIVKVETLERIVSKIGYELSVTIKKRKGGYE